MRAVSYARPADVATAIASVSADPDGAFLAGGTTTVDLLRLNVVEPRLLVDINDLPLDQLQDRPDGGLWIGATARMSDVAAHAGVRRRYPVLAQSLELGASAQLRNMASMGGNLMQRTRCSYFRDDFFRDGRVACNKRQPGSGCAAMAGVNRGHAVLGVSDHCIATHPSDLAVALVALDAVVHLEGPAGSRTVAIDDFFLLPGDTPDREHPLAHGELIVAIEVPGTPAAARSGYLKVRDRQSYEFALASAAVALQVTGGTVTEVRIALGGVATKPWRARAAEQLLTGGPATRDSFAQAAAAEFAPAVVRPGNAFKVELARRTMVRVLETLLAEGGRP